MLRLLLCICTFQAATGFAPTSYGTSRPLVKLTKVTSLSTVDPTVRLGTTAQFGAIDTKGIELAGLLFDDTGRAFDAWEWTNGIGAPAGKINVDICCSSPE